MGAGFDVLLRIVPSAAGVGHEDGQGEAGDECTGKHAAERIDADEADIEKWYIDRFLALRESVFQDPDSFFKFYALLSDEEAVATARGIWREINGRNLAENIAPTRDRASLILRKAADHRIDRIQLRRL